MANTMLSVIPAGTSHFLQGTAFKFSESDANIGDWDHNTMGDLYAAIGRIVFGGYIASDILRRPAFPIRIRVASSLCPVAAVNVAGEFEIWEGSDAAN